MTLSFFPAVRYCGRVQGQPASPAPDPEGGTSPCVYAGRSHVISRAAAFLLAAAVCLGAVRTHAQPGQTEAANVPAASDAADVTLPRIELQGLEVIYTGKPQAVQVVTYPADLPVTVTYDGSSAVPVAAGRYLVEATIHDARYPTSATGTFTIAKAKATVALSDLAQAYDGLPKLAIASTIPAGLPVLITYAGSSYAPTYPGAYSVAAVVNDPNYVGSADGTMNIAVTALVRHAPTLRGGIDGSMQVLSAENVVLNVSAWIAGDLLVPGSPELRLFGHPMVAGVLDGSGTATPTTASVALNGRAVVQYVVRRVDPIPLPQAEQPTAPSGTRDVVLDAGTAPTARFGTIRDLTLSPDGGEIVVPPGSYRHLRVESGATLVLGIAGSTTPTVYHLQQLTVSGGRVRVAAPVQLRVAGAVTVDGRMGDAARPEWLALSSANGDILLGAESVSHAALVAPNGTVFLAENSVTVGGVVADRLVIQDGAILRQP